MIHSDSRLPLGVAPAAPPMESGQLSQTEVAMKIRTVCVLPVILVSLVLICGCEPSSESDDGSTWTQLTPSTSPPARDGHAMVLATGPFIFGGMGANRQMFNDTWEWNGSRWLQYSPAASPSGRTGHAMAYDERRQQVVLFGGTSSVAGDGAPSGLQNDTWIWNGSSWKFVKYRPVWPSARWLHSMTYDSFRQRVVLHGGQVSQTVWLNDTWEWNGSSWTQIVTSPAFRFGHATAYDAGNDRTFLFGGVAVGNLNGTDGSFWWDGVNWRDIATTGDVVDLSVRPAGRYLHALASDRNTRVFLFGGVGAGGALGDTWIWTGRSWLPARPIASPSARAGHAMTFLPGAAQVMLFGGESAAGTVLGDTWIYSR